MTKINKEYSLQTFKASASNTSQFLEGKGYKIPQTTLLHALSVFVGEKNWNTLQGLLKNQSEKQTQIDNDFSKEVNEKIHELLEDLEYAEDHDYNNRHSLKVIKDETNLTLSFIKNRLEILSEEFFITWEKSKYIRDFIDIAKINIPHSNKAKLEYDISLQLLDKFEDFTKNIIKDCNYFSNKYSNQHIDRSSLSDQSIYLNTLVSTSEANEVRMNILFNFNIFCLYEIKNNFFEEIQFHISTNKNSKNLSNHSIHVFCPNEYKKENIHIFLKKVLENFQY